jgi:diaminopropionate ammonia-lyase
MPMGWLSSTEPAAFANRVFDAADYEDVRAFYDARHDLQATPLVSLAGLAARLGVAELLAKDETARFGLPAFKIVGARYAVERLRASGEIGPAATLVCATAGNHGRAVARAARDCGIGARVYVPSDTVAARREAIASEGALVIDAGGDYGHAVRVAAAEAEANGWTVVSDTSWPGYERIPRLIMAGYTRIVDEASRQWDAPPDVVIVQGGVGGLVCAVGSWWADHREVRRSGEEGDHREIRRSGGEGDHREIRRSGGEGDYRENRRSGEQRTVIVAAEPMGAACLLASARAGRPSSAPPPVETVMAGLRCADVSPLAWRGIPGTVDAFVAIEDRWAEEAMRALAFPSGRDARIAAGASGACGVGALMALLHDAALAALRERLRLGSSSRVLTIVTEGPTDPDHFARVTYRP